MTLVTNKVSRSFDNLTLADDTETYMDIETPDHSDESSQYEPQINDMDNQTLNDWTNYAYQLVYLITDFRSNGRTDLPYPNLPKQKLKDVLYGTPVKKMKLTGESLHNYLFSKLIFDVPDTMPKLDNLNAETSLDEMIPHLIEGYKCVEGLNKQLISHYMDYGQWLNVAYAKFDNKKKRGMMKVTWSTWLENIVGISASYARQLREIANMFGEYKKIRNLGITFSELLKLKTEIFNMLHEKFGDFWRSS